MASKKPSSETGIYIYVAFVCSNIYGCYSLSFKHIRKETLALYTHVKSFFIASADLSFEFLKLSCSMQCKRI